MSEFMFTGKPPEYYADSVRTGISPFTVSLTFGVQSDADQSVANQCVVRMSPQHAYVLAKVLTQNIESYEEQIGKIELPDQLLVDIGLQVGGADDGSDAS